MFASINSADYINIRDTLIKSNYSSIKQFNLTANTLEVNYFEPKNDLELKPC